MMHDGHTPGTRGAPGGSYWDRNNASFVLYFVNTAAGLCQETLACVWVFTMFRPTSLLETKSILRKYNENSINLNIVKELNNTHISVNICSLNLWVTTLLGKQRILSSTMSLYTENREITRIPLCGRCLLFLFPTLQWGSNCSWTWNTLLHKKHTYVHYAGAA